MAGSADDDQPRRRGREIQEGEVESGYQAGTGSDTDTDDEDARYYLQSRHDNDEWVNVSAGSARGNSPACSLGSDKTISDVNAAVAREVFPCTVCQREFSSWKAVNGHMRVHALAAKEEKQVAAVASGGGAPAVEEVGDPVSVSTAIVIAVAAEMPGHLDDDTITPVQSVCGSNPVVDGGSGGSVKPSQSGVAAPEQVPVAPTPDPPQQATFIPLMVPAASQQLVFDGPLHIVARSDQSTRRQSSSGNSQRGFSCNECNRWFPTHQGLGGHAAGHKNRRIAAAAAAAAAAGVDPQEHMAGAGGAKTVKLHACKICGAEYSSGVSLGGHMRKHYNGKPIVPRKRLRLCHPELALALPLQRAPSSLEAPIVAPPLASYEPERVAPVVEAAAQPPQAVPGTVRLFGVTIVQQTKKEEEPPVDEPMNEQ